MPGVMIDFEVFGHKQVVRELTRLSKFAGNAAPAWVKIISEMKGDIREQFDTQGDSMSGGWPPLKPVTIERKAAAGLRTEIMRATDALMGSLTEDMHPLQFRSIDPYGFEFRSEVGYGAYHMGPAEDGSRPARKPVDFTEVHRRKYVKILQAYLMGVEI